MRRFDEANALDPNRELDQGLARPRELLYAERVTRWLLRLRPTASDALRLAARCQHIRRWEIPRDSFPMTREGYLRWKETLKRRHAEISGEILQEVGCPEEVIQRVQSLNLKRDLHRDEECQTLEDALCLVFLEHQLSELCTRTNEMKILTALKKSWGKMSEAGREAALAMRLDSQSKRLLALALQEG